MWPQGRLLRDYNMLLDQPKAQGEAASAAGIAPAVSGAGRYTTKRRDTLWQIAARNTQGGSVQQTMLAIQALNPDAFIGNNINQLKVGQVLRLPDQQQIQNIPQGEAIREVAEQHAAWREGRRLGPRARQLDATRRGAAEAAPARIAQVTTCAWSARMPRALRAMPRRSATSWPWLRRASTPADVTTKNSKAAWQTCRASWTSCSV